MDGMMRDTACRKYCSQLDEVIGQSQESIQHTKKEHSRVDGDTVSLTLATNYVQYFISNNLLVHMYMCVQLSSDYLPNRNRLPANSQQCRR